MKNQELKGLKEKLRNSFNRKWKTFVENMINADWIETKSHTMMCVQNDFISEMFKEFPFLNECCDLDGNYHYWDEKELNEDSELKEKW